MAANGGGGGGGGGGEVKVDNHQTRRFYNVSLALEFIMFVIKYIYKTG